MKRRLLAPLVAVGLAALILVPTTFAVGEPGTTLYAQLGTNRFPGAQGAADASLHFNSERDIVLRIQIFGPAGTVNAVRVYVDGTCSNPGEWVINRTTNAGPFGPFITVNSNSGVNTIQVNQLDVDRVREELDGNPNETFALMVARVINGANYRTCTTFRNTPFPPLTTTTATTSTNPTTSATGTNTTRFTTRTTVITTGGQTFTATITEPVTTSSLTTRLSTAFSTGTSVQTVTVTGTGTTFTVNPGTFTNTATNTSTGFSTGTTTIANATTTLTSTFTTPVTTVLNTVTSTQTVTASTVVVPPSTTLSTVTNTLTVPVTTFTLAL